MGLWSPQPYPAPHGASSQPEYPTAAELIRPSPRFAVSGCIGMSAVEPLRIGKLHSGCPCRGRGSNPAARGRKRLAHGRGRFSKTYQGRIERCLDDAIKTRQATYGSRAETYTGGSQTHPAPDFFQGHVVARLGTCHVQLGCDFGVHDLLFTQFRKKRKWPSALPCPESLSTSGRPTTSRVSAMRPSGVRARNGVPPRRHVRRVRILPGGIPRPPNRGPARPVRGDLKDRAMEVSQAIIDQTALLTMN